MKHYLITMTAFGDSPDYYLLTENQMNDESVEDKNWRDPAMCFNDLFEAEKELLRFSSPLDAAKHIQENNITDVEEFDGVWY